jgi:hypothetical protein
MNTNLSIPADILEIIETKKQQLRAEQAAKEEAAKREQDELVGRGNQLYLDCRAQGIEKLPEGVRDYVESPNLEADDYVRFARGYKVQTYLTISIPGLANILCDSEKQAYLSATASWAGYSGYPENEPELNFRQSNDWRRELDYVLCQAEKQMQKHQENLVKWETAKEQAFAEYNRREASDQLAEERNQEIQQARAEQEARDEREELYTFAVLKNDAVALHLVKAFLLIQNERSHFEQRLQDADETLYSIEERWSRRAAELRNQADEADRRAADERSRLQDDLDDAEKKLKKAQRGW